MTDHERRTPKTLLTAGAVALVAIAGCFSAQPGAVPPAAAATTASTALAAPSGTLYVNPRSQATSWLGSNARDGRSSVIKSRIASVPTARWFVSTDDARWVDSYVDAASASGRVPLLGAYFIPQRDCGSYSSGGASSAAAYRTWMTTFAAGIGTRKAVVLLEPDSLYYVDCLSAAGLKARQDLLRAAVAILAARAPNATVYLDGGTPVHGTSGAAMAARLAPAGVSKARGFFVNVANFRTDADSEAFAVEINRTLAGRYGVSGRHFVIDSSRNGHGSNGQWCNPSGRKIGRAPSWSRSSAGRDGFIWGKVPGESDGSCGIAPNSWSGQFVPDLAYKLATG